MLTPTTTITGDKELDRILKDLGKNALKDADIKRGLVKLSKPIIKDIRSNINNVTKNLWRSIGRIKGIRTKKGKPFILIGPRYYGNFKGNHAHLVEVGNEFYDVEYNARLNIERAFNKNKSQTQEKLRKEILSLLDKKLKKLK
tara:strand:- start:12493 stop:12921 length:429 start_codon:yes stop_codon:yes gene_type:complete